MANCFERRAVNRNLLAADRPRPLLRHNELRNGHLLREVFFCFLFLSLATPSVTIDRSLRSSSIRIFLSLVGRVNVELCPIEENF